MSGVCLTAGGTSSMSSTSSDGATATVSTLAPSKISLSEYSYDLLNQWISFLNGNVKGGIAEALPIGFCREMIENELDARVIADRANPCIFRKQTENWHDYSNADGYNHLEELVIFQPIHWKEFVRAYALQYKFDVLRCYPHDSQGRRLPSGAFLCNLIQIAVNHPDLATPQRYEALGLLLSLGANTNGSTHVNNGVRCSYFKNKYSPFPYFNDLQSSCLSDDRLVERTKEFGVPRLARLKELFFSHSVVGQSLAKTRVVQLLLGHFGHRHRSLCSSDPTCRSAQGPLFLSFTGSQATGKTAMAREVAAIVTHPDDNSSLFLQYGSEDGLAVTFEETKPVIREFLMRLLQLSAKVVGVVVLDCFSKAADFQPNALDIFLLEIQTAASASGSAASLGDIIFIQTVSLPMEGYLGSAMSEIISPEACCGTAIKEMLTTETVQRAICWSDPNHTAHTIVPFVPLKREERIPKANLLIHCDTNTDGLTNAVKYRFAEYIADMYDHCNEALTSSVLLQEVDYWQVLAD